MAKLELKEPYYRLSQPQQYMPQDQQQPLSSLQAQGDVSDKLRWTYAVGMLGRGARATGLASEVVGRLGQTCISVPTEWRRASGKLLGGGRHAGEFSTIALLDSLRGYLCTSSLVWTLLENA